MEQSKREETCVPKIRHMALRAGNRGARQFSLPNRAQSTWQRCQTGRARYRTDRLTGTRETSPGSGMAQVFGHGILLGCVVPCVSCNMPRTIALYQ